MHVVKPDVHCAACGYTKRYEGEATKGDPEFYELKGAALCFADGRKSVLTFPLVCPKCGTLKVEL